MNIILTGSTGFIGRNLMETDFIRNKRIFFYGRDSKPSDFPAEPDIIIHCAALIRSREPSEFFHTNTVLTFELLNYFRNYKHFIYIGSSSEYGRKQNKIKETDPLEPQTIYEATKGCGSLLCQSFAWTYKLPITIVRPFSIYGRHEGIHRFIPNLKYCFDNNKHVDIYKGSHDFIYIKDFIRGLLTIIDKPSNGEIVNLGSGQQYSNWEVFKIFEKLYGYRPDGMFHNEFLNNYDTENWVCDTKKAYSQYGFKCQYSLEDGLREYINERD